MVVKIDVEGFELHAIKGMESLIDVHAPVLIFECHADAPHREIDTFLRDKEYRLYHIGGAGPEETARIDPSGVPSNQRNYLALPGRTIT